MNATKRRTRLAGLAAIAALAAMALPSPAQAGKAHLLKLYKVEKHLDLEGQDQTYTVTCPGNDLALDGMWRVDDVEPDPDYYGDDLPGGSWSTSSTVLDHTDWDLLRSVRPVKVARSSNSSYAFEFTPASGGDVSMKLWVTCLGDTSETIGSHTVSWQITNPNAPGGSQVITTNAAFTTPASSNVTSGACPVGFIVVQPSFVVTAGDADLVASYPTANATRWTWKFESLLPGFSATVSWKCLELRSQAAPDGHKHRIVRRMASLFIPNAIAAASVGEKQAICGEHYKGMIGGWDYSGVGFFDQLYFLGMDPRIKHRAFKFINRNGAPKVPDLYLVCFKDKTT
jgi:hypothetical protein